MTCRLLHWHFTVALVIALAGVSWSQEAHVESKALEGMWVGAWGGGIQDGVVFQPVNAEMLIQGNRVELFGFRNAQRLSGTWTLDVKARRLRITSEEAGQPKGKTIDYEYTLKDNALTLIDADKIPITLQRRRVAQKPMVKVHVELVEASGINEHGDLQVTEYIEIQAGRDRTLFYQPDERLLSTQQAIIYQVQESGLKKITVDEARRLIREATSVALAYRTEDQHSREPQNELWKELESPSVDSEAVRKTLARSLRPGMLVFILAARENVFPQP